jgi:hypothetical protein
MLADLRAAGDAREAADSEEYERLAERPEVREKISELMAAHWEHWVGGSFCSAKELWKPLPNAFARLIEIA